MSRNGIDMNKLISEVMLDEQRQDFIKKYDLALSEAEGNELFVFPTSVTGYPRSVEICGYCFEDQGGKTNVFKL